MQQPAAPLIAVPENWQTALAIVAHPDDLEYGTASAIAKWTSQGKRIVYVMVSKGEAGIDSMHPAEVGSLRAQEEINSARVVGVDTVEFLDPHRRSHRIWTSPATGPEPSDSPTSTGCHHYDQPSRTICQRPPEYGGSPMGRVGCVRCGP